MEHFSPFITVVNLKKKSFFFSLTMKNVIDTLNSVIVKLYIAFLPFISFAASSSLKRRGLKVIHEISCALNTSIRQLTDLFWVVSVPTTSIEIPIEVENKLGVDEVSKGIANVTAVVVVNRQVEKVDSYPMYFSNLLQEHFFRIFVWNMSDHHSSTPVFLYLYLSKSTCSGTILYSLASSPDTVRLFLWQFCLW